MEPGCCTSLLSGSSDLYTLFVCFRLPPQGISFVFYSFVSSSCFLSFLHCTFFAWCFLFLFLTARRLHSSVSLSYRLMLMIHTFALSIMVYTINPSPSSSSIPLRLTFSVTMWQYEICSPSACKSTLIWREKHALWEHKKPYVPSQGGIYHRQVYTNTHRDAVEQWDTDGAMN